MYIVSLTMYHIKYELVLHENLLYSIIRLLSSIYNLLKHGKELTILILLYKIFEHDRYVMEIIFNSK